MLLDEFRGVEMIPLNRLRELPQCIIEQIEPMFFTEEKWEIKENILSIPEYNLGKVLTINLNEIELKALKYFEKHAKLIETAQEISSGADIPLNEAYKTVTSLFFRLAELRICHPREIYRIDELVNTKKQNCSGEL